jgi:hypothetical protein
MAQFIVTDNWISPEGRHEIGSQVEIPYETPRDQTHVDKLISWGVLKKADDETVAEEPATE